MLVELYFVGNYYSVHNFIHMVVLFTIHNNFCDLIFRQNGDGRLLQVYEVPDGWLQPSCFGECVFAFFSLVGGLLRFAKL